MVTAAEPAPTHAAAPPQGFGAIAASFLGYLPGLVLAMACLRIAEVAQGARAGASSSVLGSAIAYDASALLRYGLPLLLLAWPFLRSSSRRVHVAGLGIGWTIVLWGQAALMHYHASAGVPLGADLFAYSWQEIRTTVAGGPALGAPLLAGLALAHAALWGWLVFHARSGKPRWSARAGLAFAAMAAASLLLMPTRLDNVLPAATGSATLAANKAAWFLDDNVHHWRTHEAPAKPVAVQATTPATTPATAQHAADPASRPDYPFLHSERTPDTLGPYFTINAAQRPNLVLIVVEGLGRSFSGPNARLGSFTPFLDELAQRSLYWENFLATQGRTFAVLPSLLGSVPYGPNGFAALPAMPPHAALPAVLQAQGYHTRFYTGSNLEFDNQGQYLRSAGVDKLYSERDYGPAYQRSNDWGYADRALVDFVLAREKSETRQPFAAILQTNSMHTPFVFPSQDDYRRKVEQRLAQLNVAEERRGPYRAQRDIYASILYTDDALRHYFEQAAQLPGHANTIYIVTGDHRLPEIPMETRLERYHVPLLVCSPLLKGPRAIKAVSSQFDLAPSLLAFLSHHHGIKTPAAVTWLGSGLDMDTGFRNLHALPLKQTKTELSDYVSGPLYLGQNQLYTLSDNMRLAPVDDAQAKAQVRAQFDSFIASNDAMANSGKLAPPESVAPQLAFREEGRSLQTAPVASGLGGVVVDNTHMRRDGAMLQVDARFANHAQGRSATFVPLLVLTDAQGRELGEAYGKAGALDGAQELPVTLQIKTSALKPGQYFVSVIPSHPDTGKPVGTGQYHVPVQL
ncbi:sulfatase-like hydrolase/transferase [Duganella sp. FT92W]|uniref:Sulfatase-like hydrolase/transferase n=1 Tax=Pseudoduganella rivuli TaxID=2666085 RepID=A0A7X2LUK0_9BURK|nr:LTA synthase family protein [Pseudoduganella rivuli]MRV75720.1 sulfatase-like hydrolase/transferase [Pseudoduganella rivuli]